MYVETFNIEHFMRLGVNHLENFVDSSGQTYFDVFMTKPAEAVHDWPDFVDLPSRYLEAAVMARQMLGIEVRSESSLRKWLLSMFGSDGLACRPETPYSKKICDLGENALALKTLLTLYMDKPENSVVKYIRGIVKVFYDKLDRTKISLGPAYAIRPLVMCSQLLNLESAFDLADHLSQDAMYRSNEFGDGGIYRGHNHFHLGVLAGVLSYALVSGDDTLVLKVKKCFDFATSIGTNFGFVPEVALREDDLIACETCALMDYLDVAILLARYGYPQYWDVVEKTTRNHLVESQIKDGSWLCVTPAKKDTDRIMYADIDQKVVGGFAGWSSPNHILAYEEELGPSWDWCKDDSQKPYYLGKVRALQNCCAGSGLRALFQVWRNIAYFKGDDLYVNLHIDKKLDDAYIMGYQPYEGKTVVNVGRSCDVHIRVPSFTKATMMETILNGKHYDFLIEGEYIKLKNVKANSLLEVRYPLPTWEEYVKIGNPGRKSYGYRVKWRGDTIVQIDPDPDNALIGYSNVMKRDVPLYYNKLGPGPLYLRSYLLADNFEVRPAATMLDKSTIDWYSIKKRS
jgi:hypothetical protein